MARRPVALVTGASRGIGEATTWALAARGWQVFATARNPAMLEPLASSRVTPLRLDVTDESSMHEAVDTTLELAGRIDALVNNAGYSETGSIDLEEPEAVRRQFETNAFGPLRLSQLVVPAMRAQGGGRIVHVGTVMGRVALPLLGAYSASKAALWSFNDALRVECRRFGIRVVMVIPGTVRTDFDQAALDNLHAKMPDEDSPHREPATRMEHMIESGLEKGIAPEDVAAKIVHAIETRHPKALYTMAPDARAALWLLGRLPPLVRDRLLRTPFKL